MEKLNNLNLYIKILEFGHARIEGFTYNEIIESLQIIQDSWEDKIIKSYIFNALHSGEIIDFISPNSGHNSAIRPTMDSIFIVIEKGKDIEKNENHKLVLKYDAYFNYIDYLELQAAKQSSVEANKNAKYALWAVAFTTLVSIILTIIQILAPVEIDNHQFNEIITSIHTNNS